MKRERIKKISLVDVTLKFDHSPEILSHVNFDLPLGKSVALVGEPGCGKSLILKILSGLMDPTKGAVTYNEKSVRDLSFEEFTPMRLSTAICFENGGLLMNKSIEENMKLSLQYHNQWRTERSQDLFEKLIGDFKLKNVLHLRPAQVSEGIRRIAGIARTFLLNPQIVFMDEPTLGIGREATEILNKWITIHRNSSSDTSAFVTTQDPQLLEMFSAAEKWQLKEGKLMRMA